MTPKDMLGKNIGHNYMSLKSYEHTPDIPACTLIPLFYSANILISYRVLVLNPI